MISNHLMCKTQTTRFPGIKSWTWTALIILGCLIVSPINSHGIETKSEWDAAFQKQYPSKDPLLDDPGPYPGDVFAWQGHYWVRAYVSMAQTYGDTGYLDKAVTLIDHMLYHRDDARQARGELDIRAHPYVSAPLYYLNHRDEAAPGWRRYWDGDRIEVVTDGMITQAIMLFVDLAYNDPRFSSYKTKAKTYLEKAEGTANIHNSEFVYGRFPEVPGSYYWPKPDGSGLYSGTVPFNQSAIMASTFLLLHKVKGGVIEYRRKAEAVLDYWKMHVRLMSNEAYDWNYDLRQPGDEDFNHSHIDLVLFNIGYHFDLLTSEDIQRLTNTFTKNIYKGNGKLAQYVDGSSIITSYESVGFEAAYDWIDLTRFNPVILTSAKEVYESHYANPTWSRPFLGWAEILRWSEIMSGPPQPPQNVRIITHRLDRKNSFLAFNSEIKIRF